MMGMKKSQTISALDARYICDFRPEPEGGTVTCHAFPEIVNYGESLEEARRNAREVIELCVEVYQDDGRWLPPHSYEPPAGERQGQIEVT